MNKSENIRILVVDDEPFVRDLLKDFFTKIDMDVTTAPDGASGVAACRSDTFDAALVDLKMPGKSGIEVLAKIKQIDPTLPVIMMTGFPTIDSSLEAIRRGAYDYIIKPFKLQELKELVARAVKERSAALDMEVLRTRIDRLEEELRRIATLVKVPEAEMESTGV